jgi:hypothetical protein
MSDFGAPFGSYDLHQATAASPNAESENAGRGCHQEWALLILRVLATPEPHYARPGSAARVAMGNFPVSI